MKINKKVSDLARKLEFIGYDIKERRKIIKDCLNPFNKVLFREYPTIKQINMSYKIIKQAKEEENYSREIKYKIMQN